MFNIYTLVYFPIVCYIYFYCLGTATDISIKHDRRYTVVKQNYTFIDKVTSFISGNYILLVISFIPFLNVLLLVANIFSMKKFKEDVIENRIEQGKLIVKLKESD